MRGSVIRASSWAAMRFSMACHRNVIDQNFVEGAIVFEETTNRCERTRL